MNHRAIARKEKEEAEQNKETEAKAKQCCWNCLYMQWMVNISQGIRCGNKKNEYRKFREKLGHPDIVQDFNKPINKTFLQRPLIPGIWLKCELFENKWEKERVGADGKWKEYEHPDRQQNQIRMPSLGNLRYDGLITHGMDIETAEAASEQLEGIIGGEYDPDPWTGDPY